MNLLAHALLSPPQPQVRFGNVVADFVRRPEVNSLPEGVRTGIRLHQLIDSVTDRHAKAELSRRRLVGFQRFSNPLVDIFYDHFLSIHWNEIDPVFQSELPKLDLFVDDLYQDLLAHRSILPSESSMIVSHLIEQDWLRNYGSLSGLQFTLQRVEKRIGFRTGRQVDLENSLELFQKHYEEYQSDFFEFWPDLVSVVREFWNQESTELNA